MKTSRIALIFIAAANYQLSLAASIDNPTKLLQELQNGVQNFGPQKTDCSTCNGGSAPKNPAFFDCVKLLCLQSPDSPSGSKMIMDQQERALRLIPEVRTKLLPDLQANFTAGIQAQLKAIKDLRAAIQSGDTSIAASFKTFHNFMFLSAALSKMKIKEGGTIENMQVDFDKMKPDLPELTAEDAKWLPLALNALLKIPAMKAAMEIGNDSPDHIFKRWHPNLSLTEAVKKEAAEAGELIANLYEKIFKPMGLSREQFDQYFDLTTINEVSEGTRTDEASYDAFLSTLMGLRFMNEVFAHPEKQPWILQRDPNNLDQILKADGILEKLDQAEKYLNDKDAITVLRQKAETDCVAKFAQQMAALPTKEQLALAKQQSKEVLNKLKENVFTKFSSHTLKCLTPDSRMWMRFFRLIAIPLQPIF